MYNINKFIESHRWKLIFIVFVFLIWSYHYMGIRYNEQVKIDTIKNNLKQFVLHRDAANVLLLARVINKEVNGCEVEDKLAVASSILNRLDDGKYGSTIKEVIYKENQYVIGKKYTKDDVSIAYSVYKLNVRDCRIKYFFNPKTANKIEASKIRKNKKLIFKTDCHEYYS